jgi:hypothetical protein
MESKLGKEARTIQECTSKNRCCLFLSLDTLRLFIRHVKTHFDPSTKDNCTITEHNIELLDDYLYICFNTIICFCSFECFEIDVCVRGAFSVCILIFNIYYKYVTTSISYLAE